MKVYTEKFDIFPDTVDNRIKFNLEPKISKIDFYFEPGTNSTIAGVGGLKRRFEIEFYCLIDQRAIFEGEVERIDAFISEKTLDHYDKNPVSVYERVDKQDTREVNDVTYDVVNYLENATNTNLDGMIYLTSFEPYQTFNRENTKFMEIPSLTDEEAFGVRTVFQPYVNSKSNKNRRSQRSNQQRRLDFYESFARALLKEEKDSVKIEKKQTDHARVFRRQYNALLLKGIDPLFYFQEGEKTQSVTEFLKGVKKIDKPITATEKIRVDALKYANRRIREIEEDSVAGIQKVKISKRIERIKTKLIIDEDKIKDYANLGENLIIFATGKNGIRLDRTSYKINLLNLIQNIDYREPNLDYSVVSTRNIHGKVITNIQNHSKKNNLNVRVYAKKVNYNMHPGLMRFKLTDNYIRVKRGRDRIITDGTDTKGHVFAPGLGTSFPVFHRFTCLDYSTYIANTKSTYVPGKKSPEKLLTCSFYPLVKNKSTTKPHIEISIKNVSPEVRKIRVLKRNVTNGMSKSKFYSLRDEEFKVQNDILCNINDENDSAPPNYFTQDYDVHDDQTYEYEVTLIDASGNKYRNNMTAIETFTDPAKAVNLRVTNVSSEELTEDEDNQEEPTMGENEVSFDVNIDMIEEDIDKILNSVFDDKYRLFLDEFKDLKDTSALIKGVKVSRINTATGQIENVGNFKAPRTLANDASVEGKQQFSRVKVVATQNLYCDYIYKIEPYVTPPTHILSNVTAMIRNQSRKIANKNTIIRKIGKYTGSKNKLNMSANNIQKGSVVSSQGSRFAGVKTRRGRLSSPVSLLEKTGGDIFAEGLTGDITYVPVSSPLEGLMSKSSVGLTGKVQPREVFEIEDVSDINFIRKKYYQIKITTQGQDKFVDFYIVFKRQNLEKELTIDGAMHSVDRFGGVNTYNYISRCDGSIGLLQFYVLPVAKDGTLGDLQEVASHLVSELL